MTDFVSNTSTYYETKYKITIENGSKYDMGCTYTIIDANSLMDINVDEIKLLVPDFDPYVYKLLNGDVFRINPNSNYIEIIHSNIRNITSIQGILICNGPGKNYGRVHNKYLYKCIPYDHRLPPFIVPYEIQGKTFTKNFKNKYINFTFDKWDGDIPTGKLIHTIGDVDNLENFYEYQLFCKSLNTSSIQKFNKITYELLKEKTFEEYFDIINLNHPEFEDRRNSYHIFTIDGKGTLDFDDAISYHHNSETNFDVVSVYITNVTLWIDVLDLWGSFSQRVSTIYLPDKKIPMLPNILSDCLCSLQENQNRFAIAIDFIIDENGNIKDVQFVNTIIRVFKNFIYDEKVLKINNHYSDVLKLVQKISLRHNIGSNYNMKIINSYDVISYLMILTNHYTAKSFSEHSNGIYRTSSIKSKSDQLTIVDKVGDDDLSKFLNIWNTNAGEYTINTNSSHHCALGLDTYVHITSPIRRIVDLVNLIVLQENKYLCMFSVNAHTFVNTWLGRIDYINNTMSNIRNVQTKCNLLHLIHKTPQLETIIHRGYVFDKTQRNDGSFQYMTYIPELKILSKINTMVDKEQFELCHFNVYAFNEEHSFKQKIKIHML